MTPFNNGRPNAYARGLRIKLHRGVITIGHDGLWPGYKTSFVRIPDHNAAVICISSDATSDPHDLAFQAIDAMVEGKRGVRALPPMPATDRLPGRYLNRDTGATVDVEIDEIGRVTACTQGAALTTIPTAEDSLTTSRGSADFTMRLTSEDTLEVERDASMRVLHRVSSDTALPAALPGRYHNADMAATWDIGTDETGMSLHVAGPLRTTGPWGVEPIEGDFIRVISPTPLFRAWLDGRVLRDTAGTITGLHVDGGRVRNLLFSKEPTR
jgi:D-aminopeptidase